MYRQAEMPTGKLGELSSSTDKVRHLTGKSGVLSLPIDRVRPLTGRLGG